MQSREEGVTLAVQLAECKERTRQAENSADDAHDELRAVREHLEEAESQMQQMQQRLVDTAANCRRFVAITAPACYYRVWEPAYSVSSHQQAALHELESQMCVGQLSNLPSNQVSWILQTEYTPVLTALRLA